MQDRRKSGWSDFCFLENSHCSYSGKLVMGAIQAVPPNTRNVEHTPNVPALASQSSNATGATTTPPSQNKGHPKNPQAQSWPQQIRAAHERAEWDPACRTALDNFKFQAALTAAAGLATVAAGATTAAATALPGAQWLAGAAAAQTVFGAAMTGYSGSETVQYFRRVQSECLPPPK